MLPHDDLRPFYDRVVWLWVCRTWRDDEGDLEAARTHDRFGVTSWPHLFLLDPRDDALLTRAGRSTAALASAFEDAAGRVQPAGTEAGPILDALTKAGERILELEALAAKGKQAARRKQKRMVATRLDDPDVVVRIRALRWLAEHDLATALPRAERLLLDGNDALRFALLDGIADRPTPELSAVLARLVAEAGKAIVSGNPNVVRGKAARCLVTSGDEAAIEALAPIAKAADARNSTTRTVVEALGAIAARSDRTGRDRITQILLASWPEAAELDASDRQAKTLERYALRLAEAVADALAQAHGRKGLPKVPSGWSKAERDAFLEAFERRFR